MTASLQELDDLRATLRKFLEAKTPEHRVRELIESPDAFDTALWAEMSTLGLHALAVPERFGGEGAGFPALAIVFEELGRALAPTPFFANFVAIQALLLAGDDRECERRLPRFADGSFRGTVGVAERDGSWDPAMISTRATEQPDGSWRVTGTKSWVPNATTAHLVLVFARTLSGPTLFAVDAAEPGVEIEPMRVLDATRPLATIRLNSALAQPVGRQGAGGRALSRLLDLASLALSSEQVGAAQRCLEMSVEHAKVRVQFGRPIGTFQAVKHLCAEMLAHVELARAATDDAVRVAPETSAESAIASAAAHITASAGAAFVARETIQVLGGIGFTWDHPAHLYFRRAVASEMLLGGPALRYERLLERLGI
ncbi:MAG: acyl-CoA dehydrogenase family protein [Mycobacterium sp.]